MNKKPWRNVRKPFKDGCNADVAWQHLLPKLSQRETITVGDIEAGFARVRNNPNAELGDPVGRASQYPRFCIEYGLLTPAGKGIWVRGPAFDDARLNPENL